MERGGGVETDARGGTAGIHDGTRPVTWVSPTNEF